MYKTENCSKCLPCLGFGREICGDFSLAEAREWWLSNGLGAYAAGTVACSLSRRYHGLLVAPPAYSGAKQLWVVKADATVSDGERSWPLFSNRWQDNVIDPKGHIFLESFHLDGRMPVWRYAMNGFLLESRVWMEQGSTTTCVAYRLFEDAVFTPSALTLELKIFVNGRNHHGETDLQTPAPFAEMDTTDLLIHYPEDSLLRVSPTGGILRPEHLWAESFDLPLERERGLPDKDRHLCAGIATLKLEPGRWVGVRMSLGPEDDRDLEESLNGFLLREKKILHQAMPPLPVQEETPAWIQQLVLAADSFLISRPLPDMPEGASIIAGYPWFDDWGRDAMIALPGLTLATGRHDMALRILQTFARFIDQGMIPNYFPAEGGRPPYNAADGALWYIEAWRAYLAATGDWVAAAEIYPVLTDILAWYRDGTRHGIGMDPHDGLLRAGEEGVQVTWMDAKLEGWVVTPRIGKPVEINALWYNALQTMSELSTKLDFPDAPFRELAVTAGRSFQRFMRIDGGLHDVLDSPSGRDETLRPNQILAVSLHHSPLDHRRQKAVTALCREHLLCTPGLRTLPPEHPDFHPRYEGNVRQRDGGYHQGPVWAWLLGHYAMALYRVTGDPQQARNILAGVRYHLLDAGLGTISELFDGAPPHKPRGCPSQAWSVATILEAWWKTAPRAKRPRKRRESDN